MTCMVAIVEAETRGSTADDRSSRVVAATAAALGGALRLPVHERAVDLASPAAAEAVLAAAREGDVELVVMPYRPDEIMGTVADVMRECTIPLVVVPVLPEPETAPGVERVLVPLDGTVESAQTVSELVSLFAAGGADIVVLHVFDESTVPRFWDQPVHARKSWAGEFLLRYCDAPNVRMELRRGSPGAQIADVAAAEHADLIALGWSRSLARGHADAVRTTLREARTPVLLLPVGVVADETPVDR